MMGGVFSGARFAAAALFWVVLGLSPAVAQVNGGMAGGYARIYVENRCYHTVDLAMEGEKGTVTLPPVAPRETEMIFFAGMRGSLPDGMVRLSRRDAVDKRVLLGVLLEGARHERWVMGRYPVDSWFVTVCGRELPLDDPAGATVRLAASREAVAEYEMLFSRMPDSADPMSVYGDYPVRVLLDGIPLGILKTDKGGMLRFLLPAGTAGAVTLETALGIDRTLELGSGWLPVKTRRAAAGERVLVRPNPVSGNEDW